MEKHGKEYPTFPLPFSFQLLLFKSLEDFRPLYYCKTTFRTERREESKQQVVSLCVRSRLPLLLNHKAVQSLRWESHSSRAVAGTLPILLPLRRGPSNCSSSQAVLVGSTIQWALCGGKNYFFSPAAACFCLRGFAPSFFSVWVLCFPSFQCYTQCLIGPEHFSS